MPGSEREIDSKVVQDKFFIAVHVGAGFHSERNNDAYKEAMVTACKQAADVLAKKGSADEACVAAIKVLEACHICNAGLGSNLTETGCAECDASIMSGDGVFGAIGAVAGVAHPIAAAHCLAEESREPMPLGRVRPIFLVGDGARAYALSRGLHAAASEEDARRWNIAWDAYCVWKQFRTLIERTAGVHETGNDGDGDARRAAISRSITDSGSSRSLEGKCPPAGRMWAESGQEGGPPRQHPGQVRSDKHGGEFFEYPPGSGHFFPNLWATNQDGGGDARPPPHALAPRPQRFYHPMYYNPSHAACPGDWYPGYQNPWYWHPWSVPDSGYPPPLRSPHMQPPVPPSIPPRKPPPGQYSMPTYQGLYHPGAAAGADSGSQRPSTPDYGRAFSEYARVPHNTYASLGKTPPLPVLDGACDLPIDPGAALADNPPKDGAPTEWRGGVKGTVPCMTDGACDLPDGDDDQTMLQQHVTAMQADAEPHIPQGPGLSDAPAPVLPQKRQRSRGLFGDRVTPAFMPAHVKAATAHLGDREVHTDGACDRVGSVRGASSDFEMKDESSAPLPSPVAGKLPWPVPPSMPNNQHGFHGHPHPSPPFGQGSAMQPGPLRAGASAGKVGAPSIYHANRHAEHVHTGARRMHGNEAGLSGNAPPGMQPTPSQLAQFAQHAETTNRCSALLPPKQLWEMRQRHGNEQSALAQSRGREGPSQPQGEALDRGKPRPPASSDKECQVNLDKDGNSNSGAVGEAGPSEKPQASSPNSPDGARADNVTKKDDSTNTTDDAKQSATNDENTEEVFDTVGAVVVDANGRVAAGVSSGGIAMKVDGRVGDSAVFGCGIWAEDPTSSTPGVAITTTGVGENIIRMLLAKECAVAAQRMPEDKPLDSVISDIILDGVKKCPPPHDVGVVAAHVDKKDAKDGHSTVNVHMCIVHTAASMGAAYYQNDEQGTQMGVQMLRQVNRLPQSNGGDSGLCMFGTNASWNVCEE